MPCPNRRRPGRFAHFGSPDSPAQRLYLPNWKGLTPFHASWVPIPEGRSRLIANAFGLAAQDTQQWSWPFDSDFLLCSLTGYDSDAAGYQVQFTHLLPWGRRKFYNKHIAGGGGVGGPAAGGAAVPPATAGGLHLRSPYAFGAGDSLQIELKNLSTSAVTVWIGLFGVHPNQNFSAAHCG